MFVHQLQVFSNRSRTVFAGDRTGPYVLLHRQMLENPAPLRHHDRPLPDHFSAEPVGDVNTPEVNVAFFDESVLRLEQPTDRPQSGGLARTIRHAETDTP